MSFIRHTVLAAMACTIGAASLLAQPSRPAPPLPVPSASPATNGKKQRFVNFTSLRYSREELPEGILHIGKGNVVITSDDSKLTTDTATYNEKSEIASTPGKLRLEDPYNTLTGNTGVAYYKTRDAKIRGYVVIVARPREEDKNAPEGTSRRQFDSPVTMTCQKVDYNWRSRIAQASEQLTLKEKDRTVTADHAIYDGKREMVVLEGNVHYTRPNGENGKATKVTIYYTKGKEKFFADGGVTGIFPVEDYQLDEDSTPKPSGGEPPTGTVPPGTAPPGNAPPPNAPPTKPGGTP